MNKEKLKAEFLDKLQAFAESLKRYVSTPDNQWTLKGFIDVAENVYTIPADASMVSKLLEIHLMPKFVEFAKQQGYDLVFAEKPNWYPDLSFVQRANPKVKFAVNVKIAYRLEENNAFCSGFSLGAHGEYFINPNSNKNVQYPYAQYMGHFCLGILYSRRARPDETKVFAKHKIHEIPSIIGNFEFFAQEKWKIASDKGLNGSANSIGSINYIPDILKGNGIFSKLGEDWFYEYWKNYGKITTRKTRKRKDENGAEVMVEYDAKIADLKAYLAFKGKTEEWIVESITAKKTAGNTKEGGE